MKNDKDKIEKGEVSRRDFLVGAGAVVVGGAIGAGITYPLVAGKGGEVITTTKTVSVPTTVTSTTTVGGGATVTSTVTSTVGGGATVTTTLPGSTVTITQPGGDGAVEPAFEPEETFVRAVAFIDAPGLAVFDVKNGKMIRTRPLHLDWKYTKEELAPSMWKFEARGKTFEACMKGMPSWFNQVYRKRVYSPNRIKYPLKRVDWEPGGDPAKINPNNRGKSKYKRISWDEATDIIASEVKRVQDKYGLFAVLCQGFAGHNEKKNTHRAGGCQGWLMTRIGSPEGCVEDHNGGCTTEARNADSWEGWYWGAKHIWGCEAVGLQSPTSTLMDVLQNTDMIVCDGGDWETTPQGGVGHGCGRQLWYISDVGIEQVHICPALNYAAAVHADKWIPVLPNTDSAWMLGVIYTWITEGTYDKDYIDTHSVGFDKVQAYVMGDEDGVPKTPEWASARCGIPEWTIKALAREWASKKTSTMHGYGSPMARGPYSHEQPRFEVILLAMQGLGRPGVGQFHGGWSTPYQSSAPMSPRQRIIGHAGHPVPQILPRTMIAEGILRAPCSFWGTASLSAPVEDQFIKYDYPIKGEVGGQKGTEIHLMWSEKPCNTACWNYGNEYIDAVRSPQIECYICQQQTFENDCTIADIVLPITTIFENAQDEMLHGGRSEVNILAYWPKAIEVVGESKSDYDIACEVGKKLEQYGGVYEGLYEKVSGGKNDDEWTKEYHETGASNNLISWEELLKRKYVPVPLRDGWDKAKSGLIGFYEDPVKNPLSTPSGKLEFYSERLAENFPDDEERGPMPKWVIGGPGFYHDESLWGERAKKYPILLESNHPRWREHPQCDDIPWLREIPTMKVKGYDGYMYEPIWLNPTTAAERGIENGDIVKVYNHRGMELAGAYVTERAMPGAAWMDHGARMDMITDRINRGGTVNLISPDWASPNCKGMASSGYLVEIEKVDPAEMEEWRKKYPEAFARDYDPAYGLKLGAWVEGEV